MNAVYEISDTELQGLEADCAFEIVQRIVAGNPEWWDSFINDPHYHADIACAVQEALTRTDSDDAMGSIRLALEPLAQAYADNYVLNHDDVQELAVELGNIIEMED